jgi:hypothetical protein
MACNCGKKKILAMTIHEIEAERQRGELERRIAEESAKASDAANT